MLTMEQRLAKRIGARIENEINGTLKEMSQKNKEKRIKKLAREETNKTLTIKNENVIMGVINDLMFRFIMLIPEGFENLIHFTKEEEEIVKSNIANSRNEQKLKFTKIDLIKDLKLLEPVIKKINERIGNINDEKSLESLNRVTTAEMNKALKHIKQEENLKMYENSTQNAELEVIMKILMTPFLIKKLLESTDFDTITTQLIDKLLETLDIIKKSWIKYIDYQTKDSREGKVRELLDLQEISSDEEYEEKERLYSEKTSVELKKEIKNLKTKLTKQENKNKKIENYLQETRNNFKHTEEDIEILKLSLEDMNDKLFKREMESLPGLAGYGDKVEENNEKREKDCGN